MYYNLFKAPIIIKTGNGILTKIDFLLKEAHLVFSQKILITQANLYNEYIQELNATNYFKTIFVKGGVHEESENIISQIKDIDALIIAFGGGSVLDIVKYCASRTDKPYITVPSTLSNDAIYSCVARLSTNGKKVSYGVQPPLGIIVDLEVIRKSPKLLILAGVADLVSNLSATQDWLYAHQMIDEPINELAFMLAKEAAIPMLHYEKKDLMTDYFLLDLVNGLVTSGLSMMISGNTRGTSGAEHLISHAIDEYFPDKSTIHGLQVGWAHAIIDKRFRKDFYGIVSFFERIGLSEAIQESVIFSVDDFFSLIPYAKRIRNRYTILNQF